MPVLKFNNSKFIGILWVIAIEPRKDILNTIQKAINEGTTNAKPMFRGYSFGKSDMIYEIEGSSPGVIMKQLVEFEKNLISLNGGSCCFSDVIIANAIVEDFLDYSKTSKTAENQHAITFYVFCELKHNYKFNQSLFDDIHRILGNTGNIELFYTLGLHFLIKISTNNFINTFYALCDLKNPEIVNSHTYLAINDEIIDNNEVTDSNALILAVTGLEMKRITELYDSEFFTIPVLGSFDFLSFIFGKTLQDIEKNIFNVLNDPKAEKSRIRNTSSIIGVLKKEELKNCLVTEVTKNPIDRNNKREE